MSHNTSRGPPPQHHYVLPHSHSRSRRPFQSNPRKTFNASRIDDDVNTRGEYWDPQTRERTWYGDSLPIQQPRHCDLTNPLYRQYHQSYWPDRLRRAESPYSHPSGSNDKPSGPHPQHHPHTHTEQGSTSTDDSTNDSTDEELRTWIAGLVSEHQSKGDPQNGTLVRLSTPRRIAISLEGGAVSCNCAYTDAPSHRRSSRGDCCVQLCERDAIDQAREGIASHGGSSTGGHDVTDMDNARARQLLWQSQSISDASLLLSPTNGPVSSATSFETVADEEPFWHEFSDSDAASPFLGPNVTVEPDASVIELANTPTCSDYQSEQNWDGDKDEDAESVTSTKHLVPATASTPSSSSSLYSPIIIIAALSLALLSVTSSILYATQYRWTSLPHAVTNGHFNTTIPSPPIALHNSSVIPPTVSYTTSTIPGPLAQSQNSKTQRVNITVAQPGLGGKGVHIVLLFALEGSVRVEIDLV